MRTIAINIEDDDDGYPDAESLKATIDLVQALGHRATLLGDVYLSAKYHGSQRYESGVDRVSFDAAHRVDAFTLYTHDYDGHSSTYYLPTRLLGMPREAAEAEARQIGNDERKREEAERQRKAAEAVEGQRRAALRALDDLLRKHPGYPTVAAMLPHLVWRSRTEDAVVTPIDDFHLDGATGFSWYGTADRWSDLGVENQGLAGVSLEDIKVAGGFTHIHTYPLDGWVFPS